VIGGYFTGVVTEGSGRVALGRGPGPGARLTTNQEFIESLRSGFDPNNVKAVFGWVFSKLPRSVKVYPTENYFYFSFFAGGRCYWGNFRLGVEDRDRGILHFVYWPYSDDPRRPDDSASWVRAFSARDGLSLRRLGPLRYAATYRGKRVVFGLNNLSQRRPRSLRLGRDEKYLGRSCDESGIHFFLVYAAVHKHFMWILDERLQAPRLEKVHRELSVDPVSGFAFVNDRGRRRKILVGVSARNVRRNNYWDGPFDQLPDNFVRPELARCMEEAYPYTKGRIDRFGKFLDQPGFRVALTPYLEYRSLEEMKKWVSDCRRQPRGEFCACITYDSKKARR
jgi:hypothetical protein